MEHEPLVTVASITAIVVALIAAIVSFGVNITDAQQNGIIGVVAVLAPFVVGFLARSKVAPWVEVAAQKAEDGTLVAGPAAVQPDGSQVAVVAYNGG